MEGCIVMDLDDIKKSYAMKIYNDHLKEVEKLKAEITALKEWISVDDRLPDVEPRSYEVSMSNNVLVKGGSLTKNKYPWVAHLHIDGKTNYPDYAHGFDKEGKRHTWLCPYRNIVEVQNVTHWRNITPMIK